MARPRRDKLTVLRAAAALWNQNEPDIGYLARVFAQISLPYRDPGDVPAWGRQNGSLSLTVRPGMLKQADGTFRSAGYPYGTVPRLLMTWLSTEAVRTRSRDLVLGESLSDFMRQVGMTPTGGKNGTITRLREQMSRLFQVVLSVQWEGDTTRDVGTTLNVASAYDLWWTSRDRGQPSLLQSTVRLSDHFFEEVLAHPVPLDLGALRALRGSPLRLDIYAWLTYQMTYLQRRTEVPWESLQGQFGSSNAATRQGRAQFREDFTTHFREVAMVCREANIELSRGGVVLLPSLTHALPRKSGQIAGPNHNNGIVRVG